MAILTAALEGIGYEVIPASNGGQAIDVSHDSFPAISTMSDFRTRCAVILLLLWRLEKSQGIPRDPQKGYYHATQAGISVSELPLFEAISPTLLPRLPLLGPIFLLLHLRRSCGGGLN